MCLCLFVCVRAWLCQYVCVCVNLCVRMHMPNTQYQRTRRPYFSRGIPAALGNDSRPMVTSGCFTLQDSLASGQPTSRAGGKCMRAHLSDGCVWKISFTKSFID